MAFPKGDSELVPFSTNFDARLLANSGEYGLDEPQAQEYNTRHVAYIGTVNSLMAARAQGTWSKMQTVARDAARDALLTCGRELYALVQANRAVPDDLKVQLGVRIRKTRPSPVPRPRVSPDVDVLSVSGRNVRIRVHKTENGFRGRRPYGTTGAWIYTSVGESYPSDPTRWQFHGIATNSKFLMTFPDSVANGATIWITAAWVNRRGETGPLGLPTSVNLPGGGSRSADGKIKIAA